MQGRIQTIHKIGKYDNEIGEKPRELSTESGKIVTFT